MIKSRSSLLSELSDLQQAGVSVDTLLVGEEGKMMVHWAVLARCGYWGRLRGEGEVGPVTIILPVVGSEELGDLVEQIYGRA